MMLVALNNKQSGEKQREDTKVASVSNVNLSKKLTHYDVCLNVLPKNE